jgi:hypothetical protein
MVGKKEVKAWRLVEDSDSGSNPDWWVAVPERRAAVEEGGGGGATGGARWHFFESMHGHVFY